jgi:3-hydroxybutyrate dehydrogenase
MRLNGKRALITGAGRGIGRAMALAFGREGARVAVSARTESEIESVARDIGSKGGEAFHVRADMSDREDVLRLIAAVKERFGALDILVNNAASYHYAPVESFDDGAWERVLFVNLTAPYLTCKAFIGEMEHQGHGRIINVSSIFGRIGYENMSAYCASKHGLIGFTRTLALETATTGVTVNAICPGSVATEGMFEMSKVELKHLRLTPEESKERFKNLVPQQRFLEPDEVASLAVYLASDDARGITGQAYMIDGGWVMR